MAIDSLSKLKRTYILLIGTIAILLIVSQFVVHHIISEQEDDALVINVAGRQRMLSQKITKLSLAKEYSIDSYNKNELIEIQDKFYKSYLELSEGKYVVNSGIIDSLFASISNESQVISGKTQGSTLSDLIIAEQKFLPIMDEIVAEYQSLSESDLSNLANVELILFVVSLTVLFVEAKFLFMPIFNNTEKNRLDLEKYAEALEKANTFKDGLLDNLGYQYKSSINAIQNFAEFLKDENDITTKYEYIRYILDNCNRLEMILNTIEHINKFTPERSFPINQKVNLYSLVLDTYVGNHPDIVYKVDENLTVYSNQELLSAIVKNIFSNSIKFSENSTVIVESMTDKDNIKLIFKDNGIGIGEDFLPNAFVIFNKEHNNRSDYKEGLGLGLTIAKQACDILGYEILIESEKGVGTTVTVTIPYSIQEIDKTKKTTAFNLFSYF